MWTQISPFLLFFHYAKNMIADIFKSKKDRIIIRKANVAVLFKCSPAFLTIFLWPILLFLMGIQQKGFSSSQVYEPGLVQITKVCLIRSFSNVLSNITWKLA